MATSHSHPIYSLYKQQRHVARWERMSLSRAVNMCVGFINDVNFVDPHSWGQEKNYFVKVIEKIVEFLDFLSGKECLPDDVQWSKYVCGEALLLKAMYLQASEYKCGANSLERIEIFVPDCKNGEKFIKTLVCDQSAAERKKALTPDLFKQPAAAFLQVVKRTDKRVPKTKRTNHTGYVGHSKQFLASLANELCSRNGTQLELSEIGLSNYSLPWVLKCPSAVIFVHEAEHVTEIKAQKQQGYLN